MPLCGAELSAEHFAHPAIWIRGSSNNTHQETKAERLWKQSERLEMRPVRD
jgi:hypothetical protein